MKSLLNYALSISQLFSPASDIDAYCDDSFLVTKSYQLFRIQELVVFGVHDFMRLPCYQESPRIRKNVISFQNDIFSTKFCKRDKELRVSGTDHPRSLAVECISRDSI